MESMVRPRLPAPLSALIFACHHQIGERAPAPASSVSLACLQLATQFADSHRGRIDHTNLGRQSPSPLSVVR